MKIFFVGVHNKMGKTPLDSTTKSGKLIDRIASEIKFGEVLKTNLYNTNELPEKSKKHDLAMEWIYTHQPNFNDIIVLLGGEVHKNYIHTVGRVIKIKHPSSIWSNDNMRIYVSETIELINQLKSK